MNLLQSMRIFIEVVDRQGVGRAAQSLQMAPASVSVQISNLEAHLGTTLLIRTSRNMVPTEEGEAYYKVCKRVLDDISDIELKFKAGNSHLGGRLRVDAADFYVSNLVLPVLPEFHERYPDIRIDFVQSGHVFDINPTGVDVMIRMKVARMDDTSLVARPMGTTDMVCAASPGYLEDYGIPHDPQDLAQHNCLLWIDPHSGRLLEWAFYRGAESMTLDLPYAFAFSQKNARVDAAVRGLGIIYELRYDLAQPLRDGRLHTVLEEWASLAPQSYIVYSKSRESSSKIQAFVSFLLEKYPPEKPIDPPLR
jgi:LysR family transcriptional regulator for bpeEF and oprC